MKGAPALMLAALPLLWSAPSAAQETRAQTAALLRTYFDTHNAGRLDETMALYAEDAVFQLSGGRAPVEGRQAIRELERFDVLAGSTIHSEDITFVQADGGWRADIGGAVENSRIFTAFGLAIVRAQATEGVFTFRDGKIAAVIQPELLAPCRSIILVGFTALTGWLEETGDARAPDLSDGQGRLRLGTSQVPVLLDVLPDWRAATGWRPDEASVRACAGAQYQSRDSI